MIYLDVLVGFNYALAFELMKETFSFMDLLFYGIAVYAGYRYSFCRITKEELLEGAIIEIGQGKSEAPEPKP